MGRLGVVCALLGLLLGGCATSLGDSGVVPTDHRTADLVTVRGESPLRPIADPVPVRRDSAPTAPVRLVAYASDEVLDEPPPADGPLEPPPLPDAEPPAPPTPPEAAEAPAEEVVPSPLEVIEPPCEVPTCEPLVNSCCWNPCEKGYVGAAASVLPGIGAGIEFGLHFRRTSRILWSFELGMQYQDLWHELDGEPGDGEFALARVGVRGRFCPKACGHPTVRFGLTWFNAEGTPVELDVAQIDHRGDYIGAYIGIGYEWDIGKRWSTGPEVALLLAYNFNKRNDRIDTGVPSAGREDWAIVPMFFWHVSYRL